MRDAKLVLLGAALLVGSQILAAADNTLGAAGSPKKPAAAPVKPVSETHWGRKVTDNYRYMEALDPSTIAWMKAQGGYTRAVLDAIKPLAHLKTEVAKFSASFGLTQGYVLFGGRAFYEERAPGSDNFDLIVSDGGGKRKIVDVAALRAANGGKPFAINYFLASPESLGRTGGGLDFYFCGEFFHARQNAGSRGKSFAAVAGSCRAGAVAKCFARGNDRPKRRAGGRAAEIFPAPANRARGDFDDVKL